MSFDISRYHEYSHEFALEMRIIEKPHIQRQFCIIVVLSRFFHNPLTACVYDISSLWIQLPSEKNLFEKSWWMQQICKHEHTGISIGCLFACSEKQIWNWSPRKMSNIVQTAFPVVSIWKNILYCDWNFIVVCWFQVRFGSGYDSFSWTNCNPINWHIYTPLGLNNLNIIWILDHIKETVPKYKTVRNDSGEQH